MLRSNHLAHSCLSLLGILLIASPVFGVCVKMCGNRTLWKLAAGEDGLCKLYSELRCKNPAWIEVADGSSASPCTKVPGQTVTVEECHCLGDCAVGDYSQQAQGASNCSGVPNVFLFTCGGIPNPPGSGSEEL